jgi:hypothetical protein
MWLFSYMAVVLQVELVSSSLNTLHKWNTIFGGLMVPGCSVEEVGCTAQVGLHCRHDKHLSKLVTCLSIIVLHSRK